MQNLDKLQFQIEKRIQTTMIGALDKFEKNSLIEIAKIIKNHKYENKRN